MKFIDYTTPDPQEVELTLEEFASLYETAKYRKLIYEDSALCALYGSRFKIVRYKDPVGFAVVANTQIEKGTLLFPYGGKSVSVRETPQDTEYLATVTGKINMGDETDEIMMDIQYRQQGQHEGDLGCLMASLPSDESLQQFEISPGKASHIQKANVGAVIRGGHIYYQAICDIPAGTIVGRDYGFWYWAEKMISPIPFHSNTHSMTTYAGLQFVPIIVLYDENTPHSALTLNARSINQKTISCLSARGFIKAFEQNKGTLLLVSVVAKAAVKAFLVDQVVYDATFRKTVARHFDSSFKYFYGNLFVFVPATQLTQQITCVPPIPQSSENTTKFFSTDEWPNVKLAQYIGIAPPPLALAEEENAQRKLIAKSEEEERHVVVSSSSFKFFPASARSPAPVCGALAQSVSTSPVARKFYCCAVS